MRRAAAASLALLAALPAGASASAAQPTGRVLVTMRPVVQAQVAASAVAARAQARVTAAGSPQLRLVTMRPAAGTAADLAARLRRDPRVAHAEPERRFALRETPNDPAMGQEDPAAPAGTSFQWWAARQNFPAAWDITHGAGAVVAVIDTGAEATHPEFAGRILSAADFDDDPAHGPASADEVGHGTHVSSMACAQAGNGIGIAGAGYGCTLLIVKTDLSESSVARSIVWAVEQGADAINMSFGTDGSQPAARAVVDALDYAISRNVVLVAAAADEPIEEQGDPSNDLQPTGSGSDLNANRGLSVTAADARDQRATFAGRGSQISLAAYGSYGPGGPAGLLGAFPASETELERGAVVPPQPGCRCRTTFNGDNRYAYLQGTSMAAPMVAATGALMRNLNPDLTAGEIVRMLKESARRPAGGGWSPDLGWGILDAGAALTAARDRDRRAPRSRLRGPSRVRGGSRFVLRWTGSDPGPAGVRSSGVARYEVWRSVNGRAARRFQRTTARSLRLSGRRGARYEFFTIAIDRAGNREQPPRLPDARVRVAR